MTADTAVTPVEPVPVEETTLTEEGEDVRTPPCTPVVTAETTTTTTEKQESSSSVPKYDVAEHVYEKVKEVWSWGKSVKAVASVLDAAEDVATKLVTAATGMKDLETVDTTVLKPHLAGLDSHLLNPAIFHIYQFLVPFLQKGQQTVKPIATTVGGYVLGPFGLIKPPPAITPPSSQPPQPQLTQ